MKHLTVRPETVKLLKENIGKGKSSLLLILALVLDMTPKVQTTKPKINVTALNKKFHTAKEIMNKMKSSIWKGRKYLEGMYLMRV